MNEGAGPDSSAEAGSVVYTLGLANHSPRAVAQLVAQAGAVLLDIRRLPDMAAPPWSSSELADLVGAERYVRLWQLANRNACRTRRYQPVDESGAGKEIVLRLFEERPLVVVCQCGRWTDCSRYMAATEIAEWCGARVVHLPRNEEVQRGYPSRARAGWPGYSGGARRRNGSDVDWLL